MAKKLIILVLILCVGIVIGAVPKRKPIKTGDYFLYQKTENGKVEVLFEDAFQELMKRRIAKK